MQQAQAAAEKVVARYNSSDTPVGFYQEGAV